MGEGGRERGREEGHGTVLYSKILLYSTIIRAPCRAVLRRVASPTLDPPPTSSSLPPPPPLAGNDMYTSCSDASFACCDAWPSDESEVPTSQDLCECWGGQWSKVVPQTFDNVAEGMLTLLEMSTTEGWVDICWAVVATNGARMEPIRDNNFFWALFFVLFMLLGSYLILNLFVGVVVDNFNSVRKDAEGERWWMMGGGWWVVRPLRGGEARGEGGLRVRGQASASACRPPQQTATADQAWP